MTNEELLAYARHLEGQAVVVADLERVVAGKKREQERLEALVRCWETIRVVPPRDA